MADLLIGFFVGFAIGGYLALCLCSTVVKKLQKELQELMRISGEAISLAEEMQDRHAVAGAKIIDAARELRRELLRGDE